MQRDRLLLAEMIEAAERIVELVGEHSAADLRGDDLRRDALLWNFTVLGEAATQVSDETRSAHPDVSWTDPIRLRNRIVHGYWSIEMEVLVATATEDLSPLVELLRLVEQTFIED